MSPGHNRRRTVFILPRFQGGVALCLAAVIFGGGALFSWFFYQHAEKVLRAASFRGHYHFLTSYDLLGGVLVKDMAALFVGVMAANAVLFLLLIRRIRKGVERLLEVFRMSMEGDLSTPAEAPGLAEVGLLGEGLDEVRSRTLELIGEIRADVELLRKEPLPAEEFTRKWDALKRKIGKVAP